VLPILKCILVTRLKIRSHVDPHRRLMLNIVVFDKPYRSQEYWRSESRSPSALPSRIATSFPPGDRVRMRSGTDDGRRWHQRDQVDCHWTSMDGVPVSELSSRRCASEVPADARLFPRPVFAVGTEPKSDLPANLLFVERFGFHSGRARHSCAPSQKFNFITVAGVSDRNKCPSHVALKICENLFL
jgi:hypothetical protein